MKYVYRYKIKNDNKAECFISHAMEMTITKLQNVFTKCFETLNPIKKSNVNLNSNNSKKTDGFFGEFVLNSLFL